MNLPVNCRAFRIRKKRLLVLLLTTYLLSLVYYSGLVPFTLTGMSVVNNDRTTQSREIFKDISRLDKIDISEDQSMEDYGRGRPENRQTSPSFADLIQKNNYLRISGFEFCTLLNNSRFNAWVHICIQSFFIFSCAGWITCGC